MTDTVEAVPWCSIVRAANPGPMTLDGTNTYLVHTSEGVVVIDPGPLLDDHLDTITAGPDPYILAVVTHHHHDHSEAAREWHRRTGAAVRAWDPAQCVAADPVADGEVIEIGGVRLQILHTPGHTADSICLVGGDGTSSGLFGGDTLLGRGTTIVAYPDGGLGAYLASLERLRRTAAAVPGGLVLLPGHGPVGADAGVVVDEYVAHRRMRLDQVRDALASGAESAQEVVEIVYADVDRSVWGAARATVEAQLAYLRGGTGEPVE